MSKLHELHELGQSTWLNHMRRAFVRSGELRGLIDDGIQGVTASAATFQQAILGSADYDQAIWAAIRAGLTAPEMLEALQVDDVQHAADRLRPTYEATDAVDGFVSFELDPAALSDPEEAVAATRHLLAAIDRDNVMAELPATPIGLAAITSLISDGVSINATHIFSVEQYEAVVRAVIAGLDVFLDTHSVWRKTPTAVASFSLAPVDNAIDRRLRQLDRPAWQGKAALAMAWLIYHRFRQMLASSQWKALARHGVRPIRPKWTRLQPPSFAYPATHYLDFLIGPDTVLTFTRPTLQAFLNHGHTIPTLRDEPTAAEEFLAALADLGIDVEAVADALQAEHMEASARRFQDIVATIKHKRDELESDWRRFTRHLGRHEAMVDIALEDLCDDRVVPRIWSGDPTVWAGDATDGVRLGWLYAAQEMVDQVPALRQFAREVVAEGIDRAVFIGGSEARLAPALFQQAFGRPSWPDYLTHPYLELVIPEDLSPAAVARLAEQLDAERALVLVVSKPGNASETLAAFRTLWSAAALALGEEEAGRHFAAVTDPGTTLAALASRHGFRRVFVDDPHLDERHAALTYGGLVPAALVGVDLERLLTRAMAMATNAETCRFPPIQDNLPAQLGVALGVLAREGRDRLVVLAPPALAPLARWAEALVAACAAGRIAPVAPEPIVPGAADAFYVQLRLDGETSQDPAAAALVEAGHPVLTLRLRDLYDLGGQFFLWQMATVVAGHLLEVNPFAEVRSR